MTAKRPEWVQQRIDEAFSGLLMDAAICAVIVAVGFLAIYAAV